MKHQVRRYAGVVMPAAWGIALAVALGALPCPAAAALWWAQVSQDPGLLPSSPYVPISLPGQPPQSGNVLTIGHQAGTQASWPTVFVLYTSGYVRLQPATVPDGKLGTSFILGPAYWYGPNSVAHFPQLSGIAVSGDLATGAFLGVEANGTWPHFDVNYKLRLFTPTARRMECKVIQSAVCTAPFTVDAAHQANHEGFKPVQFSSYYFDSINCDATTLFYLGTGGYHRATLAGPPGFVETSPEPLARNRVELLGCGAHCWEGYKPNAVITLAGGLASGQCTPQGWISPGAAPDGNRVAPDNVGAWLNWDAAPASFSPGAAPLVVSYRLTAQTSPQPQAWSPLGHAVSPNSPLKVVFDTPMRKAQLQGRFSLDPAVPGRFSWPDPGTMVFTPRAPLDSGQAFRVRIAPGAQPTDGHPAAAALGWTFRVYDAPPPPPIATLTATPTRGAGVALVVHLSSAANVGISLCNVAGRTVAALPARNLPAGLSTLYWDGRATRQGGSLAPTGVYLARLQARGRAGQQTQVMASLFWRP